MSGAHPVHATSKRPTSIDGTCGLAIPAVVVLIEAAFSHSGSWLPALAANLLFAQKLTGFPQLDNEFACTQVEAGSYLLIAAVLTLCTLAGFCGFGLDCHQSGHRLARNVG